MWLGRRRVCTTVAALGIAGLAWTIPSLVVRTVEGRVRASLGARVEVAAVTLGWSWLALDGVRVAAPPGWPVRDAFRARRIVVRPSLATLASASLVVEAVELEEPFLAVRRAPGEPLAVLPGLLGRGPAGAASQARVTVRRVTVREGTVELIDATVARPPHRTRLLDVDAAVDDVRVPALDVASALLLSARLAGAGHDGSIAARGAVRLADGAGRLTLDVLRADLAAFRPYLARTSAAAVRDGRADVHLDATVRDGRLHAPGRVALRHLALDTGAGAAARLLALPRDVALRALADADGALRASFVLQGPLGAPVLQLTDHPGRRVADAADGALTTAPSRVADGARAGMRTATTAARGAAAAAGRLLRRASGG